MNKKTCHSETSPCPMAHALDIIGDHWTLLIVRDMLFRNLHEYKDFISSFEGISTNILADRLNKLTCAGLVKSIDHPESKTRKLYYLTPKGKGLAHTMMEIAKWAKNNLDTVSLPPDIEKQLDTNPKGMIKRALDTLVEWELIHLNPKS